MVAQTHQHTHCKIPMPPFEYIFIESEPTTQNKHIFLMLFRVTRSLFRCGSAHFQVKKKRHLLYVNVLRTAREKDFAYTLFIKCVIFDCVQYVCVCVCDAVHNVHIPLQCLKQRLHKLWMYVSFFHCLLHRQYGNVINIVCMRVWNTLSMLCGFAMCVQHPFYAHRLVKPCSTLLNSVVLYSKCVHCICNNNSCMAGSLRKYYTFTSFHSIFVTLLSALPRACLSPSLIFRKSILLCVIQIKRTVLSVAVPLFLFPTPNWSK